MKLMRQHHIKVLNAAQRMMTTMILVVPDERINSYVLFFLDYLSKVKQFYPLYIITVCLFMFLYNSSVLSSKFKYNQIQMCKHILNVQAAIRSACCNKWFDCSDCHNEKEDHPLKKTNDMIFACKVCKKVFRKDMLRFEDADEYCPHCDNKYILDAVTKENR